MKKYESNPIKPFWSWNDKLQKEELYSQIEKMKKSGIDGFFMHARGGLVTEYLSDEWMSLTKACMDKADELDMSAWAYDENGWPSGFANGTVPSTSDDFCQKRLKLSVFEDKIPDNTVSVFRKTEKGFERVQAAQKGDTVISFDINKYYTDVCNKDAVRRFIDNTHEKYYSAFGECFGKSLKGFFTDEPQYANKGDIPWSGIFIEEFSARYGYDLRDSLLMLFEDYGNYTAFRFDFYSMVSDIFRNSFLKQIYDWCTEHSVKLTGHMMNEDNLVTQMWSTGGVMSCYDYFHEPGIDWLGRRIESPTVPKQLGSAACQLGKKTLTETFGLCGWDVSLNELKWIAQWQYVNGVTALCPHLEGYSMRGYRKRDYPASLFTQLPWFESEYKPFSDYFTNLGGFLDSLEEYAPLLVLHPMTSAYTVYNPNNTEITEEYSKQFENSLKQLNDEHICYHLGDEILLEKYGSIRQNKIVLGKCTYNSVLLDNIINITENTLNVLSEYAKLGGKIYVHGERPKLVNGRENSKLNELSDSFINIDNYCELSEDFSLAKFRSKNIHLRTMKDESGGIYFYLVNLSSEEETVSLTLDGEFKAFDLDIVNGLNKEISVFTKENKTEVPLKFYKYSSYVIKAEKGKPNSVKEEKKEYISLSNKFEISSRTENCLTLDKCSYRIDNGDWQDETAVILLQSKLLENKKNCKIDMKFLFKVADGFVPKLSLCAETPEKYKFTVNGKDFAFSDNGCFIDRSIRKSDISDYVKDGINEIVLSGEFYQNENVYRVLFGKGVHESEKNKLTYDTELESIYITGDFSVNTDSPWKLGDKRCIFSGKDFYLDRPQKTVNSENITVDGYYFFSGVMDLKQTVTVNLKDNKKYIISFKDLLCPAARLFVNGKFAGDFNFAPYETDVTEYLVSGDNEIIIKLFSGNRNLLGPHHRPYGESYFVGPATFTDKEGWTDRGLEPWTDSYSFVLFGMKMQEKG